MNTSILRECLVLDCALTAVDQQLKCPSCGSSSVEKVYDFGRVPLAGYFPPYGSAKQEFLKPMVLLSCDSCTLLFINPFIPDEFLFSNYRYVSSFGMQEHFQSFAGWFKKYFNYQDGQQILEIGANDGPLLSEFRSIGIDAIGIDPATNIVELARQKNLNIINDFFDLRALEKYSLNRFAKYIIACNTFAHISGIVEMSRSISKALTDDGVFIVEIQSTYEMIKHHSFDFIYHEHKYYYSLKSIEKLMQGAGLYLVDGLKISTHGGSYRLIFSKIEKKKSWRLRNLEILELDKTLSITNIRHCIDKFMEEVSNVAQIINILAKEQFSICGFGASGRANMLINYLGNSAKHISLVYDESSERFGREMACSSIRVEKYCVGDLLNFDYCVVLAWNFEKKIIQKIPKGPKFIIPLPKMKIIE